MRHNYFQPLICLCLAMTFMGPVLFVPGWPYNHDLTAMFERVEALRRAWIAFDFFPVWTPFPHEGRGSPLPLFYHRGFNVVAALFALPFATNIGVRCALAFIGAFGAWGMWRAAVRLGTPQWLGFSAALLWLSAPYTYLDWLVRGAAAEFAAMAIVPWLLLALMKCIDERRSFLMPGIWIGLMFHAHQSLALFLFPLLLALGSTAFWYWKREGNSPRDFVVPVLKTIAVAGILCVPYGLAVRLLGRHFHLERLAQFLPWEQFRPLIHYLIPNDFPWGKEWAGLSPELGFSVWPLFVSGIAMYVWTRPRSVDLRTRSILIALSCSLLVYGLLQTRWSERFYRDVPMAPLLQFPWRLNAMLVPVLILVAVSVWSHVLKTNRLWPRRIAVACFGASLLALTSFSVRILNIEYARFSAEELASRLDDLSGPDSGGEFVWIGVPVTSEAQVPSLESMGCEILNVTPPEAASVRVHAPEVSVRVRSTEGCTILWGQFPSPLLSADGVLSRSATSDGQMKVEVAPGEHTIYFRHRNLFSAVLAAR